MGKTSLLNPNRNKQPWLYDDSCDLLGRLLRNVLAEGFFYPTIGPKDRRRCDS